MTDERKRLYHAQTRDQFEALGRFVQAFEQMVFAIRGGIESRLQQESANMVYFTRMLFHHKSLTAWPLWEMLRGVIYTDVSELRHVSPDDRDSFDKALGMIGKEVNDLMNVRNNILHGTPFIGWSSSDQQDFSRMDILKWGVSSKGWKRTETPQSAVELIALVQRCEAAENAVRCISMASSMPPDGSRERLLDRAIKAVSPEAES